MTLGSSHYQAAEAEMEIPPVGERGRTNQNPAGIGFWALVAEDFRTHERKLFEQGFWALFVHRFGNWRMGQPKLVRAPCTLIHRILFKLVEWICGISLWYTVKIGRRVRLWHHSGMVIGARAIGDDVHLRQNTTIGVAQTWRNDELPIIGPGVDIGAGACLAGAIYIGREAKIGANSLVVTDIPDGATAMGNPATVIASAPVLEEHRDAPAAVAPVVRVPVPSRAADDEVTLEEPRDMGVIALLGSANLDYLAMDFDEAARRHGLRIATHVPPFGQARMELLQSDEESELVKALSGNLTATLVVERAEDVLGEVYAAPLSLAVEDRAAYLAEALAPMLQVIRSARERLSGPVFVLGLGMLGRSTLGLADGAAGQGVTSLIAEANRILAAEIDGLADVHLLDAGEMIAEVGRQAAQPGAYWHMGRVPFSNAFGKHLARRVLGGLLSLRGQTARILVLDLDNTLWGGVLGEDGMEGVEIGGAYPGSAYRAFQDHLRALAQRGIALAVASKNDEDLALQMMADHPEMALRPGDLVAHRIGWTEKALGIQEMLDEIGLGAQSCMFIDDNPVEREKVRKNIPGCIVPPFPAAPEDLVGWLTESPFLECVELTSSDLKRTRQYQVRAEVNAAKREFQNIEEFYRDLGMSLTFEPYGPGNQKRVLQLFAKTNQFNATLRRHDAGAVQEIVDGGGELYAVGVADRHSAYELMGVIVLRPGERMKAAYPYDAAIQALAEPGTMWVDSFLLSCRILGRTVEDAIVAWASGRAAGLGASALIGQIIEAPRNTPVRGVFAKCGMEAVETGIDLGAGGVYRHDLSAGPMTVPGYFHVGDPPEAPAPAQPAKTRPAPPKGIAPPPAPRSNGSPAVAAPLAARAAGLDAATEARLADTFRRTFQIDAAADLAAATMETVERWDSLGHLKLAMEIDQQLGIRLPGDRFGRVASYADLRAAVADHL